MTLIATESITSTSLTDAESYQVYCGLDCCLTHEIHDTLKSTYQPSVIYDFERALQGPYLEIMQRGFRVDSLGREEAARGLRQRAEHLQSILDDLAGACWDKSSRRRLPDRSWQTLILNPSSPKQLQEFFFGALRIPESIGWISQKGERRLSTNREVLEKIEAQYLLARPIVRAILGLRDIGKQLDVLETEVSPDGRFRANYNIAGTETGRPSSSANAFGTGGNAQNISPSLRFAFVADPGWKLCVIDLEQVEARDVGFIIGCLFGDWKFLDNCESGDLHTNNSKLIWPQLSWVDDPKLDKAIAETNFYREFSHRDMAKRGGHLCLPDDHEVLTPYGWVSVRDKPIEIMGFEKGKSQFMQVSNWIDELFLGELVEYKGNSISLLCTPEHRIPYISDQRTKGPIKTRPAKLGPPPFMPLGNDWIGGATEAPARLIAAFMSDGSQKTTNRMEFNLRKPRKIERLKQLCANYGFEYYEQRLKIIVVGALPKRAGAFMFEWTNDSLRDFLDEYKFWDGSITETAVSLFSVDKEHMEWIQTFGRICGIGGSLRHSVTRTNFGGTKEYVTDYYTLQQNKRLWATGKSVEFSKQEFAGRVYCPTVSSGLFYVRRRGKIFVTGNSNYMGTAWTAARSLKVPITIMEEFQARYCRGGLIKEPSGRLVEIEPAFPGIPRYWQWIAQQLQTTSLLTTPFGRRRHFFGRPGDDTTLREAIAFMPQSTTADRMNLGLWRVWKHVPEVQLLAQTYDSITFQFRETADVDDLIGRILELLAVELRSPCGRSYVVPGEAKVGWNWGYHHNPDKPIGPKNRANPDGLIKWKAGKRDQRTRRLGLQRIAAA